MQLAPRALTAGFKRLVANLELPPVRLHDLRHTHASQLLRQGVHPKVVSERLGHSTIGITLDTYSHVMPGMQEEAARRIDNALSQAIVKRRGGAESLSIRQLKLFSGATRSEAASEKRENEQHH